MSSRGPISATSAVGSKLVRLHSNWGLKILQSVVHTADTRLIWWLRYRVFQSKLSLLLFPFSPSSSSSGKI